MRKAFGYIFNNWVAKLISIVLAFGLWAFVVNTGFQQGTVSDPIDLDVRDIAEELAIANEIPDIQVEVFAPTAAFQGLESSELTAFVSAAGLEEGRHTVDVKVFADDPNVQILQITPSLVQLTLEQKQTRNFDIKVETDGQLGQGFVADKATASPDEIEVTGAKSRLDKIDQVVVRVPFNGETSDVEKTLAPIALDNDRNELKNFEFKPGEVNVKVPVIQAEDAKTVGVEVDTSGNPAEGFFVGTITVEPSTATAQGSSKALDELDTLKTETIDLSDTTQRIERTIKLELPDNIRAEPEEVKVVIEINAGTSSKNFDVPPEVINLDGALTSTVDPPSVSITISGPTNLIDPITLSDVSLPLDVAGKGEGDVTIQLSAGLLSLSGEIQVSFSVPSVVVHLVKK